MTISVNHKALELAAQDMVAKAKDIKGVLDPLDQDIRNDVMAWGGQAKSAYIPAKTQWDQSLVAMINGAEQIPAIRQLRAVVRRACRARIISTKGRRRHG